MIFANSYIIPHGNLSPGQGFGVFMGLLAVALMIYGIYMTFGSGGEGLRDEIDEHSKMHELGIAHGHEGKRAVMTRKAQEKDYPQHKHDERLK